MDQNNHYLAQQSLMSNGQSFISQAPFSLKYDREHSRNYFLKHRHGFRRRLTNWREHAMARKGLRLAGHPQSILDIPCGAGRFWSLLAADPNRILYAADNSPHMLETATRFQLPEIVNRFKCFQTSVFHIGLPDASIDNIFCMRLLHHISRKDDRLAILREFHRVSRDTVCLSLWVDGNLQARRRRKLEQRRRQRTLKNRILLAQNTAEQEYLQAGFRISGHFDLAPGISMWRLYVLKKT